MYFDVLFMALYFILHIFLTLRIPSYLGFLGIYYDSILLGAPEIVYLFPFRN